MRTPAFLKKTRKALGQLLHRPQFSIDRDSAIRTAVLLMIFISGFLIRIIPFFQEEAIMRAFDPWFQWRATEYLSEHGILSFFQWTDELSWYPFGRDISTGNYPGTPMAAVVFYYILVSLGIQADLYMVAFLLPAFMGAVTCVATYFLGKEVHNSKTGLLAAWFMVFSLGYIQRTVVGFFDNEAMGIFYIVIALYFFIRSYKRGSLISGVFAGVSLGLLGATWGAYLYLTDLFPLFALLLIVFKRYNRNLLTAYSTTMSIGLLICAAVPRTGIGIVTSMAGLPGVLVMGLMVLIEMWPSIKGLTFSIIHTIPMRIKDNAWRIFGGLGIILASGLVGLQLLGILPAVISGVQAQIEAAGLFRIAGRYLTVLIPITRGQFQIVSSVGEHLATPWGYYFYQLWTLILFIPIGFYFLYKNPSSENILILLFGLTITYFSGSLIRIILILTPAMAVIAAYGIVNLMKPFGEIIRGVTTVAQRRRQRVQRLVTKDFAIFSFIALFFVLSLIAPWGVERTQLSSNVEIKPAFSSARDDVLMGLEYMRNELPQTAVIAAWWDYGYWITAGSNRSTVCDNATVNQTQIATVGYGMMSQNITVSVEMFKRLGSTHVFVFYGLNIPGLGGDEGKWQWMTKIAWETSENLNLGWDVKPTNYLNKEETSITEGFYNTTIYKLLRFGEPGGNLQATISDIWARTTTGQEWLNHPIDEVPFFEVEFFSDDHLFKLYRIDYDAYDTWLINGTMP